MKVYISGPMSGYVDYNRPAFHAAAAYLEAKGYEVVNPARMDETHPMPDDARHADYLRRDISFLVDECDLILMLPGWRYSKGAQGEKATADLCGIDELVLADEVLWRTWEGEPEKDCPDDEDGGDAALGTPLVLHTTFEIAETDEKADEYDRPRTCNGQRGSRCARGVHVFDGFGHLAHITGPSREQGIA